MAILLRPAALPTGGESSGQAYAFASGQDSDIQSMETDNDDETPMVITSGNQDVVVVWMTQNPAKSDT
jgi:hypothetical protein